MREVFVFLLFLILISITQADWFSFTSKDKTVNNSDKKDSSVARNYQPKVVRHDNSSYVPVKHPYDSLFYRKVKESVNRVGNLTKLVFLGDSLLYRAVRNISLWDPLYNKYGAISLAGPGDKTENIINRLNTGFLRNITSNPLVVVMVGGSNAAVGDSAESIFLGITNIIKIIRNDLNQSNILLLSLLPNPKDDKDILHQLVNEKLIKEYKLSDITTHHVTFVDVSKKFYNSSNTVDKSLYFADFHHPNGKGYEIILQELTKYFDTLPVLSNDIVSRIRHNHHHGTLRQFNRTNYIDYKNSNKTKVNYLTQRFNFSNILSKTRSIGSIIKSNIDSNKNNTIIKV